MKSLLNRLLGRNPATSTAAESASAERLIEEGHALEDAGQLAEAETHYRQAVQIAPQSARAWLNLGNAQLAQERPDAAIASYREALRLEPGYGAAHANLGKLYLGQKNYVNAAEHYAAAAQALPGSADAMVGLGCALEELGQHTEAMDAYYRALAIQPDFIGAKLNLGRVLREFKRLDEAADYLKEVLDSEPDNRIGHALYGSILGVIGFIPEAVRHMRRVAQLDPNDNYIVSMMLFTMNYLPDCAPPDLFAAHLDYARQFCAHLYPANPHYANAPDPDRRLRIGYVSGDFRGHPVSRFVEPLFIHHDRQHFEVHGFHNRSSNDAVTERLKGLVDHWHPIWEMEDEALFREIEQLGIDVLIDLSGHTEHHRLQLFARKPAPVQATWLGYLGTTGLATMDYRICDRYTDPPGLTERFHTETLARLSDSQWCHLPYVNPPPVGELPLFRNGYLTLGSFNNAAKLNDLTLALWAKTLIAVPDSRLRIAAVPSGRAQQRMIALMEQAGVNADRIEFAARLPYQDYLASIADVDIALDPFPYNGGTTSVDILMMGVPMVTLAGNRSIARGGVSILSNAGLPELIATSQEDYIGIVQRLADDSNGLAVLRGGLRERLQQSPLMDGARFTRNMESLYRQMWRAWCAKPA